MTEQVTGSRLVTTPTGGLVPAHRGVRSDLLLAAAWAVADRAGVEAAPVPFYVY
jgi:hypothetical protein